MKCLFCPISSLRTTKVQQRELQDKSDSLVDLAKLQTNVFEGVADISLRQDYFQQHLEGIERHLLEIRVSLLTCFL
ncbi:Small conductance calcium-activated potassium channel protein [Paragonimus heterotremus]|uniref:Small conductance calcium-activated potassium channel protein n=1 Tax=Paragonimus heterotremus TaxID=100268 RepID=A0A8J4STV6_9TREM|nr:Small conductance calcium-activated potassium channel protein [Paragonimus heterotremus]